LKIMTVQGGDFGEEAHDEARHPPQTPEARPFGQEFTLPAYAEQLPSLPDPNAFRDPPRAAQVPPWTPPIPDYQPPVYPTPGGYGPPGYPGAPAYGGPSYPSPPPPYGPSYGPPFPPPGYVGGYGGGYGPPPDAGYGGPPGYAGPPGYPGFYDPYQADSQRINGLAIGSMITSIVGIPLTLMCFIGILASIVGLVLGAVALNQIKGTNQQGRGFAIAGIAVGAATLVLVLVLIVIVGMASVTSPTIT
jgi:Domain of unknown function (DUF4190)